jgi:hypothetical protein
MKRFLICVAGFSVGIGLTAGIAMTGTTQSAGTAAGSAAKKITIRHQLHGCHAWSLNGGPYRVVLRTSVARGGSITFVDNDVMPHTLVQKSGAAVRFRGNPAMRHMGASTRITFLKAGIYRFGTKAGEDYMSGVKTIGEDNVLRLTVIVS